MRITNMRRALSLLALAGGIAVSLSGCVVYPDGEPAYGYGGPVVAGPVVAPTVVVTPRPAYRPYGWRWRRW